MLYLDDDIDNLDLYQDMIGEHFKLDTIDCPLKFLEKLKEASYDALLIDVHLPILDGFKVYDRVKELPNWTPCPVFFISSDDTTENKIKALGSGAEDFIDRRMGSDEIKARIENRFFRWHQQNILSFENLSLNNDLMVASVGDNTLDLTTIEYKILMCLLKSNGNYVSREELIKFVWGNQQEVVLPKTLNTHLTNLRRKLEKEAIEIHSVRSKGVAIKKKV